MFEHLRTLLYSLLCVWCIIGECFHSVWRYVYHKKWVEVSVRGITDGVCGNILFWQQEFIRNERINLVPVEFKSNFGLARGEYHLEKSRFEFGNYVDGVVVLFQFFTESAISTAYETEYSVS